MWIMVELISCKGVEKKEIFKTVRFHALPGLSVEGNKIFRDRSSKRHSHLQW